MASLVSFKNGRPDRANYRQFEFKTVAGQDHFAGMAEVVFPPLFATKKGDGRSEFGDRTPSKANPELRMPNFDLLIFPT